MPATAPILETDRLRLRPHTTTDFPAVAAMWADPIVTRHISGRPFTPEESWSRLLRYIGHWACLGFGYWVVEEKSTGNFLGEIGFADYHREIDPPLTDTPEIGWVFTLTSHGKGYATEAALAVTTWGDKNLTASRTACIINPENLPSLRIAQKCGYQQLQRTIYHGHEVILFTR